MDIIFALPVKKSFATISVLIYFAFTCGVMINMHYCMDRFDSVRFFAAKSDYCTKCGMHTKDFGCCHDEVTIVKLDTDQQTAHVNFELAAPVAIAPVHAEFISAGLYNQNNPTDYLNHSPPLLKGQDIYLQNCVFRI